MRYSDFNKAERTKQYIIEKVAPVFNRKGYAGTSLADLTAATDLTKGSIYGNFKNKDEVAICAFEYNVRFIVKNLQHNLKRAETQLGKLLAYPETYRRIYKAVLANGGCPILNTSADADDLHRELHAAVLKWIAEWKKAIIHIVEKGKDAGEFDVRTNAPSIAEMIISLIEGGFAMAKATGEDSFIVNALDEVEHIVTRIKRA
jgi:TetR/AcrR family transcriptional regulator, transcriptional repressor for nem operon